MNVHSVNFRCVAVGFHPILLSPFDCDGSELAAELRVDNYCRLDNNPEIIQSQTISNH